MKKIIALLISFMLCALSAYAAGGAQVKASILRYEPAPAEQGNTADVWVQLTNSGTSANKVAVKFVPEYPFSLPEEAQGEFDLGTIAATESKVQKFSVFVNPNAPNGDRNIKFQYKFGGGQWTQLETPVTIQTQNAGLIVDEYTAAPSQIIPGQTSSVELKLRNVGKIAVKNVDVSIDLADGKFSTIGSGAKKRIEHIPAGKTELVTFTLASDTSTEVKVYAIPVTLSYQDERNKQMDETAKISLVVNAKPELSLTVDSTTFDKKTLPGTVSLKIVNKGVANLKYVTVRLVQTSQYELLSPSNEAYVGNLDSDDFETVDFTIKPLVEKPRLNLQIEFKDTYNLDFSQQYDLPLRIITAKDLGKTKTPWSTILFAALASAVVIYWLLNRKKKR
ncbi:MAG: hypothetical protein HY363_00325 [Candidatus Aenigmarchaeota archaeon]|nr:hypothetical protein [Candidatus Aenigmarchaeota archaeon]